MPEDEDIEKKPKFDPTILALKILNRCFTFQIEAIILNQTEPLIRQVKEDTQQEGVALADF
jgi:hypothetical protein